MSGGLCQRSESSSRDSGSARVAPSTGAEISRIDGSGGDAENKTMTCCAFRCLTQSDIIAWPSASRPRGKPSGNSCIAVRSTSCAMNWPVPFSPLPRSRPVGVRTEEKSEANGWASPGENGTILARMSVSGMFLDSDILGRSAIHPETIFRTLAKCGLIDADTSTQKTRLIYASKRSGGRSGVISFVVATPRSRTRQEEFQTQIDQSARLFCSEGK